MKSKLTVKQQEEQLRIIDEKAVEASRQRLLRLRRISAFYQAINEYLKKDKKKQQKAKPDLAFERQIEECYQKGQVEILPSHENPSGRNKRTI